MATKSKKGQIALSFFIRFFAHQICRLQITSASQHHRYHLLEVRIHD